MAKTKKAAPKKKAVKKTVKTAKPKVKAIVKKPSLEKEPKVKEEKVEKEQKPKKERSGYLKRDLTKYELNGTGEKLGKGKFVLAVINQFMVDKPKTTFEDLCKAFPAELQKGYGGAFAKVADVKKNELGARYFMNADQIIKTADGVAITVTNQFGAGNILAVVDHVRKLGFKVKEHKES